MVYILSMYPIKLLFTYRFVLCSVRSPNYKENHSENNHHKIHFTEIINHISEWFNNVESTCAAPLDIYWTLHIYCIDYIYYGHNQRRLKKRRETVRLSCTKQMDSARSSVRTTHPFHCPPETLIHFDLTVNLVGGDNVVCFVSLLINRAIHTTLWSSQISWSSRARRVISYRCALIGEEMRAFHCPIVR